MDARKLGEPLKYITVEGEYWLRNDGVVERRSSKLLHRHVPAESPWVALSSGAVTMAHSQNAGTTGIHGCAPMAQSTSW